MWNSYKRRIIYSSFLGYDSGASSWSGYPQYASGAEGLHVVPPVRPW